MGMRAQLYLQEDKKQPKLSKTGEFHMLSVIQQAAMKMTLWKNG